MLGLASSMSAILAGVVAASKALTFCSVPSSHRRKSSRVRPRTRVPSGAVTVHCASTRSTRERMTGASPEGADSDSPEGIGRISPVAGSREIRISCSSMRGRGSLGFCAGATMLAPSTKVKAGTRKRLNRMQGFANNFMAVAPRRFQPPGRSQGKGLLKIKIAQRLFRRSFAGLLQTFLELARQNIFLFVFRFPRFAELILAAPRLLRQSPRGIRDIHIGRSLWRRGGRQNGSYLPDHDELPFAARADDYNGRGLLGHGPILRLPV